MLGCSESKARGRATLTGPAKTPIVCVRHGNRIVDVQWQRWQPVATGCAAAVSFGEPGGFIFWFLMQDAAAVTIYIVDFRWLSTAHARRKPAPPKAVH
jgi:hypothetical protein